ncbi:phosphotransferase family protein [Streptomyces sp. NBC_00280]|uniref:phosphotransferase family protein n=1 Tax=Streptomyces sp. NBC_00280 TaxID=2975699 RepID=UPI003252C9C6
MAGQPAVAVSGPGGADSVPGVDTTALADWFVRSLPELPMAVPRVTLISGGRSNLTYQLDGGPQPLVLRRPPLGHVLATAHDMGREYRVMEALATTGVPVPRMVALCTDDSVLGSPFYLMEKVNGVVHRSGEDLDRLGGASGRLLGHALVDVLADLHSVDPQAVGLAGFGRPEGFMARQLRRWLDQLASSRTRDLPGAEELADRLAASLPRSPRPALVHGDYRLDNVIADPAAPGRIAAVLDWEMATLGDPLSDLGMFCVYWDGLGGLGEAVPPAPGCAEGWPSREELVDRYAVRSGVPVGDLDWYVAFAFFKIAAILEGIHCRHLQGLTLGAGFDRIAAAVPVLIERGHAALLGRQ